jgi:hypothetical protein
MKMTEWRAPEEQIRRALATGAHSRPVSEEYLFAQGYITSDHDDRQRAIRDAARDARILRQAPEPVSS